MGRFAGVHSWLSRFCGSRRIISVGGWPPARTFGAATLIAYTLVERNIATTSPRRPSRRFIPTTLIDGTTTFLVGEERVVATAGTFLRISAGITHDFENRTARRAGVLNVFLPGGFECNMPRSSSDIAPKLRAEGSCAYAGV
jgi:hypothetical protein